MNTTSRLLLAGLLLLIGLTVWVILADGHPQELATYQMTTELMTRWVGSLAAVVGLFRLATTSLARSGPAEVVLAGTILLAGLAFAQPNWATVLGLAAVLVAILAVPAFFQRERSDDEPE